MSRRRDPWSGFGAETARRPAVPLEPSSVLAILKGMPEIFGENVEDGLGIYPAVIHPDAEADSWLCMVEDPHYLLVTDQHGVIARDHGIDPDHIIGAHILQTEGGKYVYVDPNEAKKELGADLQPLGDAFGDRVADVLVGGFVTADGRTCGFVQLVEVCGGVLPRLHREGYSLSGAREAFSLVVAEFRDRDASSLEAAIGHLGDQADS